VMGIVTFLSKKAALKAKETKMKYLASDSIRELQVELYGEKALKKFQHLASSTHHESSGSLAALAAADDVENP